MPRPPKPAAVLREEKKSHRTKRELEQRQEQESALLSGKKIFARAAVKNNEIARKEYNRLHAVMKSIHKDDALYAPMLNRYCELYAEEVQLKEDAIHLRTLLKDLEAAYAARKQKSEKAIIEFTKQSANLLRQLNALDAQIMAKRKMQNEIEKENCMTVAAALRTIPKEAAKKEETDPLIAILKDDEQ